MKNLASNLQIYIPTWVNNLLKVVAFVVLMYFLFRVLETRTSEQQWLHLLKGFGEKQLLGCMIVICFMPLNWAFEARKWQLLLRKIYKTNFINSYRSVLFGATLGNLSPFMVGDFVGRLRSIPNGLRTKAGIALLISNGMQMFVLILFGKLGYEMLFLSTDLVLTSPNLVLKHTLTALIIIGILFFSKVLNISKLGIPISLNEYSKSTIAKLLLLSIIRHLIFTFQFITLLWVFDVDLSINILFGLVSIVFLFKTLGAALGMFGDILSRQLSAVYFFGLFSVSIESILTATTMLWVINIFVPMFIGAFFILSKKQ